MKIGTINQQGDITTRSGSDNTNPEAPNGESFNVTTGTSDTGNGGSINLVVGTGSVANGTINIKTTDSSTPVEMRFFSDQYSVNLKAPTTLSSDVNLTLPSANGTSGQYLRTDSSGHTSWNTVQISEVNNLQSSLDLKANTVDVVNKIVLEDAGYPIGFVDRAQTTISFDDSSRTFTITPTSTDYHFYVQGVRFTKTAADTVTISNTDGLWFIYYTNTGTLTASQSHWTLNLQAPVAIVYWSSANQNSIYFADERHTIAMDWSTHQYLHNTIGTKYQQGFDIGNYTIAGDGTQNSDYEISLASGIIDDEDISILISNSSTPTLGNFEQVLMPVASLPILYRTGTVFDRTTSSDAPLIVTSGVAQYNLKTGNTWANSPVPDGDYVASWVIATNDVNYPIVYIPGQRVDAALTDARENNTLIDFDISTLPFSEFKFLYRLIYKANSSFTNDAKLILKDVADLRPIQSNLAQIQTVISHSSLSDLFRDDHPQYVHVSNNRTISATHTFNPTTTTPPFIIGSHGQGQMIAGLNADQLDGYHAADFQPISGDLTAIDAISATTGLLKKVADNTWTLDTSAYLTSNQTITLSGDATGSGTTSIAVTLSDSGVSAGSFTQVTVDSKGRVTAGNNRTITGTTDQIIVSNGDQSTGNPTISIDTDPVLPGVGGVRVPVGTTVQQPSPSGGTVRYNSDTGKFEASTGTEWANIVLDSDTIFHPHNLLRVTKNPSFGDFLTIKDALATITGPALTNTYVVHVCPGTYVEDPFEILPYVTVEGEGRKATIIMPANPNQNFVTIDGGGSLKDLSVLGVTGSGKAAILTTGANPFYSSNGFIGPSLLQNITIGTSNTHIRSHVTDNTVPGWMILKSVYFYADNVTSRCLEIIAENGSRNEVTLENPLFLSRSSTMTEMVYVTGPGSLITLNSFTIENQIPLAGSTDSYPTNIDNSSGNGIRANNGAMVNLSGGTVMNYNRNIWMENSGASPTLNAIGVTSVLGGTYDLWIDHPVTYGSYQGTASKSKILINYNTWDPDHPETIKFYPATYTDYTNGTFGAVGGFEVGPTTDLMANVTGLIGMGTTMGLLNGGILSVNSGLDLDISSGFGYVHINDPTFAYQPKEILWPAATVTLGANSDNFIYIDHTGSVQQGGTLPDLKAAVYLGRVFTNATDIIAIDHAPVTARSMASDHELLLREAIGAIYSTGSIVTENATTALELDVTPGQYFFGGNKFSPSGGTTISINTMYHVSSTWSGGSPTTTVDNAYYDNGTDLTAISSGKYVKHILYVSGQSTYEDYDLLYGNAEYSTLNDAKNADLPAPPPYVYGNICPIAAIIVQEGNPNIVDIQDIRPVIGFKAGSTTGVTRHGDLTGLTSDDHPQYLLTNGGRAMTGDLSLGSHNLTNVGTINSINLASHGSRHNPNGADPLSTGAPVTSLTSSSTNAEGTANSYARSDHSHQISGFQPINDELTAISGLSSNGILTRTSSTTAAARTITGTTNQITLSNGDGVSGNPTIGLASNPIIPGTGSLTLPQGTTANQPGAPASGMLRFNTTNNNVEYYNGTAWKTIQDYSNWTFSGDATGTGNETVTLTLANSGVTAGSGYNTFTVDAKGRVTSASTTAYLTANQNITVSGDATGSGTTSIPLTLANTGVTAGTYTKVTVNAKGLVTAATSPTTLSGYGITDAQPLDPDLTAIAALTGTSGFLKTNGTGTWTVDTNSYLTGNQTITLSGDVTGSGTTSIAATLSNTGVTAGTYKSVTVDAKGRVTAATNPTTLAGFGIADAQPLDSDLTAIAALTGTSGFLKTDGSGIWSVDTTTYLTSTTGVTTFNGGTTGLTPASATSGAITLGGTLVAPNGGTGQSSYAVGDILYASTTTALSKLADVATGNALISGGVGVAPSYGKIGLTTHVTGTLAATNGGTGQATFAVGDILYASTTTALSRLADVATGSVLLSGGVGVAPSYGKVDLTAMVSNALPIANGGTGATTAAGARTNLGLVIGTNVQAWDADLDAIAALTGTSGFLKTNGSGTWTVDTNTYLTGNQTITLSGDVTGSGTTAITTTLANSGVTAGSGYNNFTVDAKGRVTSASTVSYENTANKGVANGYASLDSSGLVPASQLPSYVDDVLEYANFAALPGTGETGKIYTTLDTNKIYRWSGSAYIEISASPGSTDAVPEGSVNLYFTPSRARSAISVTQNLTYNSSTGLITGPDLTSYLTSATAATTYQPLDSDLTAIAALTGTSGFLKTNGSGTWTVDTNTYLTSAVTTFSAGTTGLTPSSATSGAVTLGGTLAVANGGTGQTSYTNGQILIGNTTGNTLTKSTLTAGGTVTITNGAGSITISAADQFTGTVTSVAALTLGTTGTDLSSSIATGTTTPVITLNVPTASATARGVLSSADWTTFNNKQPALGFTPLNSAYFLSGLDASKPAAGTASRIYVTSDTGKIYYDTGSAWIAEVPAYTGDVTSAVNGTVLTLSNSGVTAGSGYNTFTVDAKGRVTSASTTAYLTSTTGVTTFSGGTTGLTPSSATSGAISLAGTLSVTNGGTGLGSIAANYLLAGSTSTQLTTIPPSGTNTRFRWNGTGYSWVADTLANLTDVTITTPSTNQVLTWNGTAWVNSSIASSATSYSTTISSWTLVSGNLYSATVTHNLGTKNVSVTLYDTANNTIVYPDSIVLGTTNALTLTVAGNSHTINVTVMANGTTLAPSSNAITVQVNGSPLTGTYSTVNFVGSNLTGSASGGVATVTQSSTTLLQRFVYQASSLETPNNSDWVVNALAPVISDATYPSINVRSFATGSELGVGYYATIPTGATSITFNFKGRAATAPGSASTVILRLYTRSIPNNAAVGSWSAATTLTTITIPTNAFYQYTSATFTLAALGLTAGNMYQFELTRNSGTLTSAWYMAEMNMEVS